MGKKGERNRREEGKIEVKGRRQKETREGKKLKGREGCRRGRGRGMIKEYEMGGYEMGLNR